MTFTELQYSLGIKDENSSPEYVFIIRGLIRELFERYGIAITRDVENYSEAISGGFDTPLSLTYKNLVSVSINPYIENVDYVVDYSNGTITILSTGDMNSDVSYTVVYSYYFILNEFNEELTTLFPNRTFVEFTEPPPDLKFAFFTAVKMRYESLQAKTFMVSSIISPEGSKTTYKDFAIPKEIRQIFQYYSPFSVVSVG